MIGPGRITYRKIRFLLHALFWIIWAVAASFILSYSQNYPFRFFLYNLIVNLPVYLLYTYLTVYILIGNLLRERNYLIFFPSFFLWSLFCSVLRLLANKFLFYDLFIPRFLRPEEWFNYELLVSAYMWLLVPAIFFSAIKFYKDLSANRKEKSEIEKRQLASELQLLKAQLNPHFLFNTLNNLYVLALKKSDKTPEVIAKMSEMFYYILYECNAVKVPLGHEIKLIENYIDLEMMRYSDRLKFTFTRELENQDFQLPPMLLFSIAENCFKHGSSKDPGQSWIRLELNQTGHVLDFKASNSKPEELLRNNGKEGVGLANIKKRLDLLYKGNYNFQIFDEKNYYCVTLTITNED